MKKNIAFTFLCCTLSFTPLAAQQMTAFEKVGSGEESVQEFFPGEHRARPVLGDYTNSGNIRAYRFSKNPMKFYAYGTNGMLNITYRF